eukprot:248401-Ditylum_brightwellii.AAC.2
MHSAQEQVVLGHIGPVLQAERWTHHLPISKWHNHKKGPAKAMVQLRQSIQCLVALLADNHNPMHLFMLAKLDVKDGFWCLVVNKDDAWNFCYVLPPKNGKAPNNIDDIKIFVPQSIQMG